MTKYILSIQFILLSGCNHLTIWRGNSDQSGSSAEYHAETYLWGILKNSDLPSERQACPQHGIDSAELSMSAGHVLLSLITLGSYMPQDVRYICAKPD